MYRKIEPIVIGFTAIAACGLAWMLFSTPLIANPTSPGHYLVARAFELTGFLTICYYVGKALAAVYKCAIKAEARRYYANRRNGGSSDEIILHRKTRISEMR